MKPKRLAEGELQDGKRIDTLEKTGSTQEEMKRATTFEKGQVVEFTSKSKTLDVEKGDRATVTGSDSRTNIVTAQTESGREIKFDPAKVQGKELYDSCKGKEFAVGDKIAVTNNGKDSGGFDVKNGQTGSIEKIEGNKITAKMESGEKREFDTEKFKHIDLAYAVTSYKSQGQTIDNVMDHHNTESGRHGDRETYVNDTRAREGVTMYTQNADKAAIQSGQKLDKEQATPAKEQVSEKQAEKSSAKPDAAKEASAAKPETKAEAKPEQSKDAPAQAPTEKSTAEQPKAISDRSEQATPEAKSVQHADTGKPDVVVSKEAPASTASDTSKSEATAKDTSKPEANSKAEAKPEAKTKGQSKAENKDGIKAGGTKDSKSESSKSSSKDWGMER